MRNIIQNDREFNILSRSIDNACTCKVVEVREDCFTVKLNGKYKYEKDESVELFSVTNQGQVYFETLVKNVDNDIVSIWFPLSFKYLQRREYSRVTIEKQIEFNSHEQNIPATIFDFSAGGLRAKTNTQLSLGQEYKFKISIENKDLELIFEPMRIETTENGFVSSGKFKDISNFDRVVLVQYCFRKYIENSIK